MKHVKPKNHFFESFLMLILLGIFPLAVSGEVPQTMSYQGYLTDANGAPVNGSVDMLFKLYNVASGGSALWSETQSNVMVDNGVYNTVLGSINPINLSFDAQYFLGVAIGADPEMTPRQALTSTAYAIRAAKADNVSSSASISTQNQIVSTMPAGTAPLQVASTTMVPNLNSDMVDGKHASDFVLKAGDTMTGTLNINQAASGLALYASSSGGNALYASTTAGTGTAGAFEIINNSNSFPALFVATDGTGRAGYFGIGNASSNAAAIYGTTNGGGSAVHGLTTGSSTAGYFQINNASSNSYALYVTTNSPIGAAAFFNGNVAVNGSLSKGSGTFVQPHPTNPGKEVVYAFFEGPEHAVFLRGKARLVDGRAVIETPEYWRIVAGADEDITVQFTPRSEESEGLAAVEVKKDRIVVRELKKGRGSYEFDYFITAKRAGFEKHEPLQTNAHFRADGVTKEEFEQRYAKKNDMTIIVMKNLLISNGILTPDGKLNRETAAKLGWTIKEADMAANK